MSETNIDSEFNACMYREHCRKLERDLATAREALQWVQSQLTSGNLVRAVSHDVKTREESEPNEKK